MDLPGRPSVLGPGDRVRCDGVVRTVVGVWGTLVRLADVDGSVMAVALPMLQAYPDFAVLTRIERSALPAVASLEGLPAAAVERALWWERHIVELLHGLAPDAPPGAAPKPEYDPERHSLTGRERARERAKGRRAGRGR